MKNNQKRSNRKSLKRVRQNETRVQRLTFDRLELRQLLAGDLLGSGVLVDPIQEVQVFASHATQSDLNAEVENHHCGQLEAEVKISVQTQNPSESNPDTGTTDCPAGDEAPMTPVWLNDSYLNNLFLSNSVSGSGLMFDLYGSDGFTRPQPDKLSFSNQNTIENRETQNASNPSAQNQSGPNQAPREFVSASGANADASELPGFLKPISLTASSNAENHRQDAALKLRVSHHNYFAKQQPFAANRVSARSGLLDSYQTFSVLEVPTTFQTTLGQTSFGLSATQVASSLEMTRTIEIETEVQSASDVLGSGLFQEFESSSMIAARDISARNDSNSSASEAGVEPETRVDSLHNQSASKRVDSNLDDSLLDTVDDWSLELATQHGWFQLAAFGSTNGVSLTAPNGSSMFGLPVATKTNSRSGMRVGDGSSTELASEDENSRSIPLVESTLFFAVIFASFQRQRRTETVDAQIASDVSDDNCQH